MMYLTTKMQLEEWIIGATYSVKERGGTITLLGKLVDKHLLDRQIVLDFKKEDGQEHLYFVEEGVEYINHILPQEVEATQNITVPLMSTGLV
jgi:hypothetical protein